MMVLLTLLWTGLVTVEEAFSGFSSPAVITVWGHLYRQRQSDIQALLITLVIKLAKIPVYNRKRV